MSLAVETRNIHKTFQIGKRTLEILKGITLQVPKREFLAIVGPSGSGKSTLLGLIGSLDTPTSGEIWIDGIDIIKMTEDQLAEVRNKKVGFVFQFFNLINSLTALENVALPASLNTSSSAERAEQLLDLVGLHDRLDHRPAELSGGEQQRVAMARALINNPTLILADEPTGNLDSQTGQHVIDLLCKIQKETNTTLILATHNPFIAQRASRVLQLKDGVIS
jgi:putative ABC transport system ATP-binding protein